MTTVTTSAKCSCIHTGVLQSAPECCDVFRNLETHDDRDKECDMSDSKQMRGEKRGQLETSVAIFRRELDMSGKKA